MTSGSRHANRLVARVLAAPTFGGAFGALVFWWRSLAPTLLPRGWLAQALVSAVCVGVGYLIGTLVGWVVGRVLASFGREPGPRVRRPAWIALGVMWAVVVVVGSVAWLVWQNDQRDLVQLDHLSAVVIVPMLVVTGVLFAVLALVARLLWFVVGLADRWAARHMPRPVAHAVVAAVVVVVGVVLAQDVVLDGFTSWANHRFKAFDTTTQEGIAQPTSAAVSGSPDSLVPWDTLGTYGRTFVASATSEEVLRSFAGDGADLAEPVRAYVGLRSADSLQERADLAVGELDRAGGFDRDVLVVVTTTGTGWVDPDSARTVEILHAGDVAQVGLQYSYLPSWISVLVDRDEATAAGTVLYQAVHDRWSQLPEASRPELIVFGESLGSYGAEKPFVGPDAAGSLADMVAGTDGALFTGPTEANSVWDQLTDARQAGTPVWRPVYGGGTSVQFANRPADLLQPDEGWRRPRVLYVHHPSDPVGSFDFETIWRWPEWMDEPRGYDVPSRGGWFPVVTFVQEVADLVAGFSAPSGYGHNYTVDFASAWAAVVPPPGWSADDTQRLQAYVDDLPRPPGS